MATYFWRTGAAAVSARTEFVAADAANELAEVWAELKRLSGLCDTLLARSLTHSKDDAELTGADIRLEQELQALRVRLTELEKEQDA